MHEPLTAYTLALAETQNDLYSLRFYGLGFFLTKENLSRKKGPITRIKFNRHDFHTFLSRRSNLEKGFFISQRNDFKPRR